MIAFFYQSCKMLLKECIQNLTFFLLHSIRPRKTNTNVTPITLSLGFFFSELKRIYCNTSIYFIEIPNVSVSSNRHFVEWVCLFYFARFFICNSCCFHSSLISLIPRTAVTSAKWLLLIDV